MKLNYINFFRDSGSFKASSAAAINIEAVIRIGRVFATSMRFPKVTLPNIAAVLPSERLIEKAVDLKINKKGL